MFLFKLRAHNYAPFSPNQKPLFRGPVLSGQLLGADPYRPCPFLSLPVITFSKGTILSIADKAVCSAHPLHVDFNGPILYRFFFNICFVSLLIPVEQVGT